MNTDNPPISEIQKLKNDVPELFNILKNDDDQKNILGNNYFDRLIFDMVMLKQMEVRVGKNVLTKTCKPFLESLQNMENLMMETLSCQMASFWLNLTKKEQINFIFL